MAREYLKNAGVEISTSVDPFLSEQDDIHPKWIEEKDTYGFASPELWNLDRTMLYLLYERLCMWQESGYSGSESVEINGCEATIDSWVEQIISWCEVIFDNDSNTFDNEESSVISQRVWELWSKLSPVMWV